MPVSPIFDSFYQDRSGSGNTDQCINLYPEYVKGPKGPVLGLLLGVPGRTSRVTVGTGPIRGFFKTAQNLCYVVSGNQLYFIDYLFGATMVGTLQTLTGPVHMVENPTQLMLVDGVNGWWTVKGMTGLTQCIPNTNTDAFAPTVVVYQDGFAIVNSTDNQVYQSNYNDFSLFATPNGGGLGATANNAFVQTVPTNVLSIFENKREVWFFKESQTEVWINQGNAGFSFVQLQGVNMSAGIAAPHSIAEVGGGSFMWLGTDGRSEAMVFQSVGYQAKPVATHSIAGQIQGFSTVADAIAYSYQADGHFFYVLTFPTANITFCYDLVTEKWHQRAAFANGSFNREEANCYIFFGGLNLVGDSDSGNIYSLDNSLLTDAGVPRKWLRSWRALPDVGQGSIAMTFDELQIMMETGITAASGANPQLMLRWSDDDGYSWPGQVIVPMGKIGETAWRVINHRMGSTRIGTGLDRIWEISSVDPVRVSISGAEWQGGPS